MLPETHPLLPSHEYPHLSVCIICLYTTSVIPCPRLCPYSEIPTKGEHPLRPGIALPTTQHSVVIADNPYPSEILKFRTPAVFLGFTRVQLPKKSF